MPAALELTLAKEENVALRRENAALLSWASELVRAVGFLTQDLFLLTQRIEKLEEAMD